MIVKALMIITRRQLAHSCEPTYALMQGAWQGQGHVSVCSPRNLYVLFLFAAILPATMTKTRSREGMSTQRGQVWPFGLCAATTATDELGEFTDGHARS